MPVQQLDNGALLLAYLAGELRDEERARVEQRLASDAGLRQALDALREAYEGVGAALRAADASTPPAVSEAAAARRFGRQVRSGQARDAAVAATAAAGASAGFDEQSRGRSRIPGWAYPMATAATILLAYAAWQRLQPEARPLAVRDARQQISPMPQRVSYPVVPPPAVADRDAYDGGAWSKPNALIDADDRASELVLSETEDELYALSVPAADDDDVPTILLLGEFE